MKMRKLMALVMALCLLAGHLPATAWAAEETPVASGTCGDNLTWALDETGLLTISGTGEMTSAPWLTDHAASITAVHMEQGITSVYKSAFSSCTNLVEVSIPEGVTAIGNSAFYGCTALPELTLPQSLRSIGKSAFSDCDALTEIVIPEGVTEILLDTFAGCYKLASVTVPSTVTSIDQCAFLSCPSLKSFVFPEGIGIVESELFMNCYTLESVTIPSSVCVIKACAFQDCDRLGEVTIPECVFSIGDYAFYKSGITALWVGHGGEVDRTLGSNTIPSIPDGIGRYSFSSCSSLTVAEIGPEIRQIGEYAFAYSALTQCAFLGDIPTIDATAFFDVTATVYYPLDNATYTEETMLDYGGTLTWVGYEPPEEEATSGICGDNLTWALDETGLLTISGTGAMYDYEDPRPRSATAGIAPWMEKGESITRLVVEEGVTYLGTYAFAYLSALEEVSLADSVEGIGLWAFVGTGLTSVTLPASLAALYPEYFAQCAGLTEFRVPEESTVFCSVDGVVYSKDKATLVLFPCGRGGSFAIPEGTVTVAEYAFAETLLTEVTMPQSLTCIQEGAFTYSATLSAVKMGPLVQTIGAYAFSDCAALEEVTLPLLLSELGDYAFGWCVNLKTVYFPFKTIATVGRTPFQDVTAVGYRNGNRYWSDDFVSALGGSFTWYELAEGICGPALRWKYDEQTGTVTISGTGPMYHYEEGKYESSEGEEEGSAEVCLPGLAPWGKFTIVRVVVEEGVTTIGDRAFEMMMDNAELSLPSTLEKIGSYAFAENFSGAELVLPEGLTEIGEGAFAGWEKLQSLIIPDSVTRIGDGAFISCFELQNVIIGSGVEYIGDSAFGDCESLEQIWFQGDAPESIHDTAFCYVTALVYYPKGNATWTEDRMLDYGGDLTWETKEEINTGGDISWHVEETTLYITGTGPMDDYTFDVENLTTSAPWVEYSDVITRVVIEEGVTTVGIGAFGGFSALVEAELPSGLTQIRESAFDTCLALERVVMPESLEKVGVFAFFECSSLTQIQIPAGVTAIEGRAFAYSGLTGITLPASLERLGTYVFEACTDLTDVWFLGSAPIIEENAFSGTTVTVYYNGDDTWTEEVMQQYGGTLTWQREGKFTLSGTSVSLGDSLDMHFFIDPSYVDADCYAVLTRYYSSGTDEVTVTVPYSDWNTLDDGRLYVTYGNIAAKEMGDYVTVEICDGEGNAISDLYVDSVKSYTMRMLEKEEVIANQELRTLYVDMLNYGAAAQAQFGYNVTMLANDLLTEEQLAYATASCETESNLVAGTGRAGTSLTLKSRITLDFIFKNTAIGTDYTGLYAVATYTDHYGNEIETRIDTVKVFNANLGYVSVPGLAVADYAQAVTCTVYDAEGNILAWATDSMEGYAHRMKGSLPQMVETIVKFGNSSYNYFH